ncbi:MAG: phage terminase large subunit [Candidatus Omnitrophica bacterium]|nr:phage terminase large subunit [Candidatus Omnitrophota bacterium]
MDNNNMFNEEERLRREAGKKSFKAFTALYLSHYLKTKSCAFHDDIYAMLDNISLIEEGGKRLAVAGPRGSAKSVLFSFAFPLWNICYKKAGFILLLSDTSDQADTMLSHIKNELETNERLIKSFPEVCEIGQKPRPDRWARNEIVTRNGVKVTALGAGQKIRGRRNKALRPDLIIVDDIENDENTQSEESRAKLFDWFTKAVLKAGTVKTTIAVVGTIQHYDSLLAKLIDEDAMPGWEKRKYKSVIEWAERKDLWQQWKLIFNNREPYKGKTGKNAALAFFLDNKDAMLEGTKVLWEEKENYYDLMVMRESELEGSFDSEKQNEPVSSEWSLYNPVEFRTHNNMYRSTAELLQWMGNYADIMGSCDPASGEYTNKGDYSAIILGARDRRDGLIYLIEADIKRRTPNDTVNDIIAYCKRYKVKKFGVEANYFQSIMVQDLEKRIKQESLYQTEVVPIKNTQNKRERIQSLHPLIKNGTIIFNKLDQTLLDQFRYFPKGKYDDGPDAVHMLVEVFSLPINQVSFWISGGPHYPPEPGDPPISPVPQYPTPDGLVPYGWYNDHRM